MPHSDPRARRITRIVERWFEANQRDLPWRHTYDPYQVWVSEVMLQQTRMEVVLRHYTAFISRFPTIAALAAASEDDVVASWSGLGYYRRARMLREGAQDAVARFGGRLPSDVAALRTVAGIGRYTAGAIASIAFRDHAPIVDGNVARILARLESIEHAVGSTRLMQEAWGHAGHLVEACRRPRLFNQGLMEIGALICRPRNPDCAACPLRGECSANRAGRVAVLPLPKSRPEPRAMRIPLYLIADGGGRVLMRREGGPLMKSLFHLPHGDTSLLTGRPLEVIRGATVGSFRHTVTTRRIDFELIEAELAGEVHDAGGEYCWVHPGEISRFPHPSYVTKALKVALERAGGTSK